MGLKSFDGKTFYKTVDVVYADLIEPDDSLDHFTFTIKTDTNAGFTLPVKYNGIDNTFHDLYINWGDRSPIQHVVGNGGMTVSGIHHIFPQANAEYNVRMTGTSYIGTAAAAFGISGQNIQILKAWGTPDALLHPNMVKHAVYEKLFYNNTQLTKAPVLPTTNLSTFGGTHHYSQMFYNNSALVEPPELPATTVTNYCYQQMFYNSGITKLANLPAQTIVSSCYNAIYNNCTKATGSIVIEALEVKDYAFSNAFQNCKLLNEIVVKFTSWGSAKDIAGDGVLVPNGTAYWVDTINSIGTFKKPSALPITRGIHYIPTSWSVVNI